MNFAVVAPPASARRAPRKKRLEKRTKRSIEMRTVLVRRGGEAWPGEASYRWSVAAATNDDAAPPA